MDGPALDRVFAALAHPDRRRIIDLLVQRGRLRPADLADRFKVSRIAVLKQVRVLEAAGLVTSEKVGRERFLDFNAMPIQLIYDRWSDQYAGFWTARLSDLKARLEQPRAGRISTSERKVRSA